MHDPFVDALRPFVDYETVCPEVQIGLGVPRDPVRVVARGTDLRLVQPVTGRDLTEDIMSFAGGFLDASAAPDGFILKSRSPSCGIKDTKIFSESGPAAVRTSAGFFGRAVLERHPLLAVEDEGRLNNDRIWDHFLKRAFAFAEFRQVRERRSMADLVRFQARNKFLLMSYSQKELRVLGRIVANQGKLGVTSVMDEYRSHLGQAMAKVPRPSANVNVAMHMFGFFSERLDDEEKDFFMSTMEDYRSARVPLSVPVGLLRAWAIRFKEQYLLEQTFLQPYPADLSGVVGKGEARDLRM